MANGPREFEPLNLIVIGASGFGHELSQFVRDAIANDPRRAFKGFLDDAETSFIHKLGDPELTVLGNTFTYEIEPNDRFLIAVGSPQLRIDLAERIASRGGEFATLVHPRANVAPTASLGVGTIVAPFASVGSMAQVGEHTLINSYATAGHDSQIGSHTIFSPYAMATGAATLGKACFLGSHAMVTPTTKVGDFCKIAAASVVYHDVPDQSIAAGNPAKSAPLGVQEQTAT